MKVQKNFIDSGRLWRVVLGAVPVVLAADTVKMLFLPTAFDPNGPALIYPQNIWCGDAVYDAHCGAGITGFAPLDLFHAYPATVLGVLIAGAILSLVGVILSIRKPTRIAHILQLSFLYALLLIGLVSLTAVVA